MTQPGRIWDFTVTDCSKCRLDLLDAIAGSTDEAIFRVNARTGGRVSLESLADLREECQESTRRDGSRTAWEQDAWPEITNTEI